MAKPSTGKVWIDEQKKFELQLRFFLDGAGIEKRKTKNDIKLLERLIPPIIFLWWKTLFKLYPEHLLEANKNVKKQFKHTYEVII